MVEEPTRGDKILDLMFSNCPNFVLEARVGPPLGCSDHNTVWSFIDVSRADQIIRKRYVWSQVDSMGLQAALELTSWGYLLDSVDINDVWDAFKRHCL